MLWPWHVAQNISLLYFKQAMLATPGTAMVLLTVLTHNFIVNINHQRIPYYKFVYIQPASGALQFFSWLSNTLGTHHKIVPWRIFLCMWDCSTAGIDAQQNNSWVGCVNSGKRFITSRWRKQKAPQASRLVGPSYCLCLSQGRVLTLGWNTRMETNKQSRMQGSGSITLTCWPNMFSSAFIRSLCIYVRHASHVLLPRKTMFSISTFSPSYQ